ncbi:hypothetical protein ASPACDRAFT_1857021 [Aspergillus aculeatus ATCC 16872]|uniref:Uncharacterized protein n=1 Tax=Aspergillus aculeatus (strain ATCC 16872 / CBS 172.66 / WB 5094) TaxID=690307 RepID=A0A1L9WTL1_ASPA1|nr:uncharacterized protein ASPACDRAFT_1857021 [Aspergillus aculeatus ATCC 16872]OJJ99462.1 hypothetical protein ASPACDRAFT_1857021 [Aspergillus aculeatus ATCC 16872]
MPHPEEKRGEGNKVTGPRSTHAPKQPKAPIPQPTKQNNNNDNDPTKTATPKSPSEAMRAALTALKPPNPPVPKPTPLEVLDSELRSFFAEGIQAASNRITALRVAVLRGETAVDLRPRASPYPPHRALKPPRPSIWNLSYVAATLVLLLASPPDREATRAALKWQSQEMAGLPSMAEIWKTASADLGKRFAQAKKVAIDGKVATVTVLGVDLVDVEMLDRGEIKNRDRDYTSFAHTFVLTVGREGFRVYQAWRAQGHRFDQVLGNDGSRLRSWAESKSFLRSFGRLCRAQKKWSPELNSAYQECFGIDLDSICGEGRPKLPVVPVYRPWVRIFEINDVKVEHIWKFTWDGTPQKS